MGILGTITGQVRLDIRQAVAAYATLRAQNAKTVYAMRGAGDSFRSAGKVMMGAGIGLLAVFGEAVKKAADFERRMDFFQAVTNASSKDMDKLGNAALNMAANSIYSADQVVEGFVELGKAGVSAQGIIHGIGKAMINLGAAGDIPLIESGQTITSTIQQFGLSAKDATHITDLLAGAANASIADISDLAYSLKYAGGVAAAVGVNFDSTTTALSILAKAGIKGSTAGTSLRQMLVSLSGATKPAEETMKKLGIITKDGTNLFFDQHGKAKSLAQVFQILQDHTAKLSQKERLAALRTIFNNRALAAASILTRAGAKGFRNMYKEMSKVKAADVARKRMDNLSGDLKKLKANIDNVFIRGGTPMQKTLRGWVQSLTRLVKAFGNLSPKTQANIIQFIGITGAVLTAMGAFAYAVGTVLKFWAALKSLAAGAKFVAGALGLIEAGGEGAGAGLLAAMGPIGWIILAVVALVAAFVLAYKKIAPFRDWVNKMGKSFMNEFVHPLINGGKAVVNWFKDLPKNAQKAWNGLKNGVSGAVHGVINWFTNLKNSIVNHLKSAAQGVGHFVSGVVNWFKQLPGRVIGGITSFVGKVTKLLTFRNIGYAIGFMVGKVVGFFARLAIRCGMYAAQLVARVITFFQKLPGRVSNFVSNMANRVATWFAHMAARAKTLASNAVNGTINWFKRLPGRIATFVSTMAARVAANFVRMASRARQLAANAVNGVINWFQKLPGRVANFVASMAAKVAAKFSQLVSKAKTMASNIYNGIVNGIKALPGAVSGIIGNMISAFESKIASAAAAVKNFAAGLWKGFKDGLGIHSPSYIEKAMWQITGVVDTEAKKLAKHTMRVQKLSKTMAKTQFGVGDLGTNNLRSLAAQRRLTGRSLSHTAASHSTQVTVTHKGGKRQNLVEGELKLHPSGRAFIRGVAQEAIDDDNEYDDNIGRM